MTYPYDPDYCISPGTTLQEYLDHHHVSRSVLAYAMGGLAVELIDGIIEGRIPITPSIARKFEYCGLGLATLWMNLEQTYRAGLAAGKQDVSGG